MKKLPYLLFLPLLTGCVFPNSYSVIAPGYWRATLYLQGKTPNPLKKKNDELFKASDKIAYEEVTEGQLPFTFEVIYTTEDSFYIEIINGEERIQVTDIQHGHNKKTGQDTIVFNFPIYESYIRAVYEDQVMEGEWVIASKSNYRIPFVAKQGESHRFTTLRKPPKMDVSGKWQAQFEIETDRPFPAIGEFQQQGNRLTGTFLTETGDYRFLEGTVQEDKVYLSCFDGSHAFLFEAKIMEDRTLTGIFWSGHQYKTNWSAVRNEAATLANAYEITQLKAGYETFDFEFPDPQGNLISSNSPQFQNKALIVQLFGTWCPNCRDETAFLSNFYKNKPENLEIIALAFERRRDFDQAATVVQRYKDQLELPYPMLVAGTSSKDEAGKILPMLNQVASFPTLLFIDANRKVRKIHTGFSGPATSEYPAFQREFNKIVTDITATK